MTALNLFPYRERVHQKKVSALLAGLGASAVASLLAAVWLSLWMRPGPWAGPVPAIAEAVSVSHSQEVTEHKPDDPPALRVADIDRMHEERSRRLTWLGLLYHLATVEVEGVTVGRLTGDEEGARIEMWAASPSQLEPWMQALENLASVHVSHPPLEVLDQVPQARVHTMGYRVFRVDVSLDSPPAQTR